jgi:lysozyme family protein
MSDFEKAVQFVLEHEVVFQKGHYNDWNYVRSENVSGDKGGLTKYGIDFRSHKNVDIENLTLEGAKAIYKSDYWLKGHCDKMPWPLCLAHFDACVNTGIGQAAKFLQRAIGVDADGAIGPKSLKALEEALKTKSAVELCQEVIGARKAFYKHLAEQDEDNREFLDGWLNRVADLQKSIDQQNIC